MRRKSRFRCVGERGAEQRVIRVTEAALHFRGQQPRHRQLPQVVGACLCCEQTLQGLGFFRLGAPGVPPEHQPSDIPAHLGSSPKIFQHQNLTGPWNLSSVVFER